MSQRRYVRPWRYTSHTWNYVKGKIKAKAEGQWNRVVRGMEVRLDNEVLERIIYDDLDETLREFYKN